MWLPSTRGVIALITLATIAGSAWFAYSKGKQAGMTAVQTLWDSEKLVTIQMLQEQALKAQERQATINALAVQARRAQREANDRIAALERDLTDSLRDRPEARAGAGGVPEAPGAGTGCTGEGLARPDADFLARYAADAARLQSALAVCTAAYRALGGEVID